MTGDVVLSAPAIQDRVRALALDVRRAVPQGLCLVGVLRGAAMFMADLARAIPGEVRLEYLMASSYGAARESQGVVRVGHITGDVFGLHVVVVEDIVDTGRTADAVLRTLYRMRPASLRLCSLLDKPSRRVVPVTLDFKGFEVADEFVAGYGLDAAGLYRNLPDVRLA